LLTEPVYSQKIREFIAHDTFEVADIDLLKFGRHFRLPNETKLVVGRHQEDNEALEALAHPDYLSIHLPVPGPYSLIHKEATPEDIALALRIALTYGKSSADEVYTVSFADTEYTVQPFETKAEAQQYFFDAKENHE
jgi:tRNA-specific 2-thiouridylase